MEVDKTSIPDLYIITPKVFKDQRGYFFESYNNELFQQNGIGQHFVQDNESMSAKGVLRGLHFQVPPYSQGKLVRVIKGSVLDVAVDLRKKSPTFGKWESVLLSQENKRMFWVPPGFAHGFVTLEENTVFFYKCTKVYNKTSERAIIWNDADLNIDWQIKNPILADKDEQAPFFRDFESPF